MLWYMILDLKYRAHDIRQVIWTVDRLMQYISIVYCVILYEFLISTVMTIMITIYSVTTTLNQYLQNLSNQSKSRRQTHLSIEKHLKFFRHEHSSLIHFVFMANRTFFSSLIFYILLFWLPMNIYLISFLLMRQITHFDQLACLLIITSQAIAFCTVLFPLLLCNHCLPKSAKYFVRLQIGLTNISLQSRLRQHNYYELIHTKTMYGFTVGFLHVISERVVYEASNRLIKSPFSLFFIRKLI